jgi:hypothetical protein
MAKKVLSVEDRRVCCERVFTPETQSSHGSTRLTMSGVKPLTLERVDGLRALRRLGGEPQGSAEEPKTIDAL